MTRHAVIHTPDQRLRVFISSTLEELAKERLAAKEAISNLHLTPVMFELGARPHPPREVYSAYLEQSHIFIGIYGERYGWIVPGLDISGLEDEFHLSVNHPRLIYIKKPAPNREERLKVFLEVILNSGISCKFFSDGDELCELEENDLALLITDRFEHGKPAENIKPGQAWIPVPPNPLIGRESEIKAVKDLLNQREHSLITLTGSGGSGKTRLALEIARQMQGVFRDGVYYVQLVSLSDAGFVIPTIVQTIFPGELSGQPPLQLLIQLLSGMEVLIVLDNFEQVIAAAPDISELLSNCGELKILITSREPLRLSGEREFRVPMLRIPGEANKLNQWEVASSKIEECSAVQLFIQRAQAINPSFKLTRENAAAIAEICNKLDGLPLAIELAAARIRVLTPQAMLPHLGQRLALLTTGARDFPERHRTLMATIDWSFRMLKPEEQQLLSRLAVFSGGCTLQAAYLVTGSEQVPVWPCPRIAMYMYDPTIKLLPFPDAPIDFIETMESLVSKNLIYCQENNGEIRFMMYVTINEYAQHQLMKQGDKELIAQKHFNYYLRLTESLWSTLRSAQALQSFSLLDSEIDNIREALNWSLDNCPEVGLRIVLAMGEYWDTRGMPDELIWRANAFLEKIEINAVNADPILMALTKIEMARGYFRTGNFSKCEVLSSEVMTTAQQLNNDYLYIDALQIVGLNAAYSGDFGDILQSMEEVLNKTRSLKYVMATIEFLQHLAAAANFNLKNDESIAFSKEAMVLAEEIGAKRWSAVSQIMHGYASINIGEIDAAEDYFAKALQTSKRYRDSALVIYPLIGMAQVNMARGNMGIAVQLIAAVDKFCERKGSAIVPVVKKVVTFTIQSILQNMGSVEFQRLYEIGSRLQLEETIKLAASSLKSIAGQTSYNSMDFSVVAD